MIKKFSNFKINENNQISDEMKDAVHQLMLLGMSKQKAKDFCGKVAEAGFEAGRESEQESIQGNIQDGIIFKMV